MRTTSYQWPSSAQKLLSKDLKSVFTEHRWVILLSLPHTRQHHSSLVTVEAKKNSLVPPTLSQARSPSMMSVSESTSYAEGEGERAGYTQSFARLHPVELSESHTSSMTQPVPASRRASDSCTKLMPLQPTAIASMSSRSGVSAFRSSLALVAAPPTGKNRMPTPPPPLHQHQHQQLHQQQLISSLPSLIITTPVSNVTAAAPAVVPSTHYSFSAPSSSLAIPPSRSSLLGGTPAPDVDTTRRFSIATVVAGDERLVETDGEEDAGGEPKMLSLMPSTRPQQPFRNPRTKAKKIAFHKLFSSVCCYCRW